MDKLARLGHFLEVGSRAWTTALGTALCLACGGLGCTFTTLRGSAIEHAIEKESNAETTALLESPLDVRVGERIEAGLELIGVSAGHFAMRAGPPCRIGGRTALPLAYVSESTGLLGALSPYHSEETTWIDIETGYPLYKRAEVELDGNHKRYLLDFRGEGYHATLTRMKEDGHKTTSKRHRLPDGARAHDLVSAILALRRWRPERGVRSQSYVILGTRLWRAEFVYLGEQPLEAGESVRAIHIEGVARKLSRDLEPTGAPARSLSLWLGADAARVPLKVIAQDPNFTIRLDFGGHVTGRAHRGEPPRCDGVPHEPTIDLEEQQSAAGDDDGVPLVR